MRSKRWRDGRDFVVGRCEVLRRQFGGDGEAVLLKDIARHCGVRRVVFRPMLIDGSLARYGRGFAVYVKADAEYVEEYASQFERLRGAGLPPRTRFTIAHEIVHTMFFDATKSPPEPRVLGTHPQELESLEQACDMGANHLLLPTDRIGSFLERADFLSAMNLLNVARRFEVSTQVLISGLRRFKTWGTPGAVAIVTRKAANSVLSAFACDITSAPLFRDVAPNVDARVMVEDSSLLAFGGPLKSKRVVFKANNGRVYPGLAECATLSRSARQCLVTLKLEI